MKFLGQGLNLSHTCDLHCAAAMLDGEKEELFSKERFPGPSPKESNWISLGRSRVISVIKKVERGELLTNS